MSGPRPSFTIGPAAALSEPELTGHIDGFCLRFASGEVDVFPTFDGAADGLRAARAALAQLEALLSPPTTGAA